MTLNHIVSALVKTCGDDTLAAIISALLSTEDNPDLTDDEAEAGQSLFDALLEAVPESTVELAQSL
jgi:hypothetical protein